MAAILVTDFQLRDPFEAYAEACYLIEKELHQTITPDYPVAKFMAQLELLRRDFKRQERELKKARRRIRHGRYT